MQQTPKGAWSVATMLFLYMLVNFADKAVVGLAAVPIMKEMNLSPKDYGLLGSSFFLLFSVSAILVGFVANRKPTRWIILLLALTWAVVQFPMVGSVGFATLLVWARGRDRRRQWPCMRSTNGSRTKSAPFQPRSCPRARLWAWWSRCRC